VSRKGLLNFCGIFGLSNKATDSTMVQAIEMCLNRKGKEIVEKWLKDNKSADKAHENRLPRLLWLIMSMWQTLLWPLVLDAESLPRCCSSSWARDGPQYGRTETLVGISQSRNAAG
jgi:hypothetical protein